MNESTKTGFFNWRARSTILKAQVVGAVVGVLTTIGVDMIAPVFCHGDMSGPGLLALLLWANVFRPAAAICKIFGWNWQIAIETGPSLIQVLIAVLINALLLCFVGTFIGWLLTNSGKTKTRSDL